MSAPCFSFWFEFCWLVGQLDLASFVRRLRCVFLLVDLLQGMKLKMTRGWLIGSPNKWLAKPLICRRAGRFFSAARAIEVMGQQRGRDGSLELADWVRAHRGVHRGRGAGACSGGRRPTNVAMSLHLLAEGRPSPIPPGHVALREAVLLLVGSHGFMLWRPGCPKWCCPRRRRVESGVEVLDLIAFLFSVRGPSCKSPGTCVYFPVSLGSFCNMCCTLVI